MKASIVTASGRSSEGTEGETAEWAKRKSPVVMNQSHLVEAWPLIRLKEYNRSAHALSSPTYICAVVTQINESVFWVLLKPCLKHNKSHNYRTRPSSLGKLPCFFFLTRGPLVVLRMRKPWAPVPFSLFDSMLRVVGYVPPHCLADTACCALFFWLALLCCGAPLAIDWQLGRRAYKPCFLNDLDFSLWMDEDLAPPGFSCLFILFPGTQTWLLVGTEYWSLGPEHRRWEALLKLVRFFLLGPEHRRWEALLKLVRFFFLLLFRLFEGLFEGFNMLKKLGNFAEN